MIPARLQPLLNPTAGTSELARVFADAGHELYLVGGTVRDAFLDRSLEDVDLATDARPEQIKELAGPWADDLYLMGEAFGTVGAVRRGSRYEITTFRADVYQGDSRKPQVAFSDDIETDLSRRDFTVNALAIRLPGGAGEPVMVDPFGGLADLTGRILRTPMAPEVSFGDDPLRMLRLFRFVATLGFDPDPGAVDAVVEMAHRLSIVSAERIRTELDKLIIGEHIARALTLLVESGLADEFIPELTTLALQQDPLQRHKDVLAHSIAVVDKTRAVLELRLAALFHDIGKPATRAFTEDGVSFHHHEVVGARMTRERMRTLRYPKHVIRDVSQLVFMHMRPHTYKMGWTDSAVRRYVRDAGPLLGLLNELVRCDVTTRSDKRRQTIERRIDELEARIDQLRAQEELDAMRPPIDGNQVMEFLGLEPGPIVGEVMDMLYERRIEEGPYSEADAYRMLDEWRAAREE